MSISAQAEKEGKMIATLRSERLKCYVHQRDDQKNQSRLKPSIYRRTRPRTGTTQNENRNSLARGSEPSGARERSSAAAQSAGQTSKGRELIDLTGRTFGCWAISAFSHLNQQNVDYWHCVCHCDKHTKRIVDGPSLRRGHSRSCGCLRRHLTHGDSGLPEYWIWTQMIQRCTNPKNKNWKNYGGRGITICDHWRHSYPNFLADMGRRPSDKNSIDRIDNSKGYEPQNCKWATHKEQNRNSRHNRIVTVNGVTGPITQVCERLGFSADRIDNLMRRQKLSAQAAIDYACQIDVVGIRPFRVQGGRKGSRLRGRHQ